MIFPALGKKPNFLLFCLLLIAVISRIPLLFPDRMILDGDEALMGLMSIHQLELGEVPWFFWGQRYGFSLIEVSSISLFHQLIGYNDLAVKLGMMVIWLLALSGMFLFIREKLTAKWAFAIVLLFVVHPVWFYWSLKARGGYHTALAGSVWLFYLATRQNIPAWLRGLGMGILLALIYHAMKLWIPSSILLAIGLVYRLPKKMSLILFALGGFLVVFLGLYLISLNYPDYWRPIVADLSLWQKNLVLAPERFKHFFEGNYFLGDTYPIKNWTFVSWQVSKWILLISLVFAIIQWQSRADKIAQIFFFLAPLSQLGVLLISSEFFSPRYLLPAPFLLFFWCALQWEKFRYIRLLRLIFVVTASVFLAGAWQLTRTEYYQNESRERLDKMEISARLLADGYRFVFFNSPETHWQIMYFSEGKLVCSGLYPHDRYQDFPDLVRRAYFGGEPVPAMSAHNGEWQGLAPYMEPYGVQYIIRQPELWHLDSLRYEMRILRKK